MHFTKKKTYYILFMFYHLVTIKPLLVHCIFKKSFKKNWYRKINDYLSEKNISDYKIVQKWRYTYVLCRRKKFA